jgi:hypothetical protein
MDFYMTENRTNMKRKIIFLTLVSAVTCFIYTGCASYAYGTRSKDTWKATFINESYHTIRISSNQGSFTLKPRSFLRLDTPVDTWIEFEAYDVDAGERCNNTHTSEVQIWWGEDGIFFQDGGALSVRDPLPELENE